MAATVLTIKDPPLTIPADVFGLDGFLRWVHSPDFPEGRRASFLAGEVTVEMSPEELITHNYVKADLSRDLGLWVMRRQLGRVFADRALLTNDAVGLSTEPDMMICLWETLRKGRARLAEAVQGSGRFLQVCGSPDLVIEIISDTSVRKDTVVLPDLYLAAEVQEYWLIDARRKKIGFQLFTRGRRRFTAAKPDNAGYLRSGVLKGSFRLIRKKDPIGGSQYRLLAKA
jgi:Uma2 family endonuclease